MTDTNMFTIPATDSFIDALAVGVLRRYGEAPETLSRVLVLLPNHRSCDNLSKALLRHSRSDSLLLPRICPLGEVDENIIPELWQQGRVEARKPVSDHALKLILMQLVERWQGQQQGHSPSVNQLNALADSLTTLMNEMVREDISPETLRDIVPEHLAIYWQESLAFLEIALTALPAILAEKHLILRTERANQLMQAVCTLWQESPPEYPVIIAGTTGSMPTTASLIQTVLKLPEGVIVLPGLEPEHTQEHSDQHPQATMLSLLAQCDVDAATVQDWPVSFCPFEHKQEALARRHLFQEMMRPAALCEQWAQVSISPEAIENITLLETATAQEEADAIALMIRHELESSTRNVAVVTANRSLAKALKASLSRWNIMIDDSTADKVLETSEGIFFMQIAQMVQSNYEPEEVLACIKHPLFRLPEEVGQDVVAKLDLLLRGCKAASRLKAMLLDENPATDEAKLLYHLRQHCLKLEHYASVSERLDAHRQTADALSDGAIYTSVSGKVLHKSLEEIQTALKEHPHMTSDYASLIQTMLAQATLRDARQETHTRLALLSPLEARLQYYEMCILAGVNEGMWPQGASPSPWMNRQMRASIGMPDTDKRIGLAAHDFLQCLAKPRVVITRSIKEDGVETMPSRWLTRIVALLRKDGLEHRVKPEYPWAEWARALHTPEEYHRPFPPEPKPSIAHRPIYYSPTSVELLMRNPYGFYAKKILQLYALDPINKPAGALERGNIIHAALEDYVATQQNGLEALLESGKKQFEQYSLDPATSALWWSRYERIAQWFVEHEALEYKQGLQDRLAEQKGNITLDAAGTTFTLEAKADRIECYADGQLHMIDYKTGTVPKLKDIVAGVSPQIVLEGVIASRDGFPASGNVTTLAFWKLSGGDTVASIDIVKKDISLLMQEAEEGLKALFTYMHDATAPYRATPNPDIAPAYNDYAHLAREALWA